MFLFALFCTCYNLYFYLFFAWIFFLYRCLELSQLRSINVVNQLLVVSVVLLGKAENERHFMHPSFYHKDLFMNRLG